MPRIIFELPDPAPENIVMRPQISAGRSPSKHDKTKQYDARCGTNGSTEAPITELNTGIRTQQAK